MAPVRNFLQPKYNKNILKENFLGGWDWVICLEALFIYSSFLFFSNILHISQSLLYLLLWVPPHFFQWSTSHLFPWRKDQFSLGTSIQLCIVKCNKARYISSYKCWTRQPRKRKKFHEQIRESDAPSPIVRNPQKLQAKESQHNNIHGPSLLLHTLRALISPP